jgi:large subunit ribosomal protein L22
VATVEDAPRTAVRAEARYVRTAPRKAQLVVDQIRGRTVPEARTILTFMTRDAARDVRRVLDSAVANAEANHGLVGDELYVAAATVGAGPTLKRWRARARGRVARIKKRTCHVVISLELPSGDEIPAPIEHAAPVVETAPPVEEEEAPVEEKPKRPARTSKAKPPKAEEEKPKRAPRARAAAKPKAEGEAPKPKRAPRKKKPTEDKES